MLDGRNKDAAQRTAPRPLFRRVLALTCGVDLYTSRHHPDSNFLYSITLFAVGPVAGDDKPN